MSSSWNDEYYYPTPPNFGFSGYKTQGPPGWFQLPSPDSDPARDTYVRSLMHGGLGRYETYNPWTPNNYLEFLQYASHLGALPAPSQTAFQYALGRMGLHPDLTRIQGGLVYHFDPNSRRWRVVGTAEQLYYMSLDIQRDLEREKVPGSLAQDMEILYKVRPRSAPRVDYPVPVSWQILHYQMPYLKGKV